LDIENVEELFSLASAGGGAELTKDVSLAIAATLDYAQKTAKPVDDWKRFQIGVSNRPDWTAPASWTDPLPYTRERKGQWYSCPPYDFYAGVMASYFKGGGDDSQDTIITFNYDTLVEEALRHLGVAFNYGLPVDSILFHQTADWIEASYTSAQVELLKLHGSMNWEALLPRAARATLAQDTRGQS
jgi:SIR2-like domain